MTKLLHRPSLAASDDKSLLRERENTSMQSRDKKQITAVEFVPRLDSFLAQELSDTSRAKARGLCQAGLVRINGKRSKAGSIVEKGDVVEVSFLQQETKLSPEDVSFEQGIGQAIEIVYEDKALLVINKPREIHSVRQQADDPLTLADIVSAYIPNAAANGRNPLEAGLVQRLDFFTSGLVMVAKSSEIWEVLHRALLCGGVRKQYLALVDGLPSWKEKKIEVALAPANGRKSMKASSSGKQVVTEAKVAADLPTFSDATFVEAVSYHTIRHQIRAHLCEAGHCLVGDELYGSTRQLSQYLPEHERGFFLHAQHLSLKHPVSNEKLELVAAVLGLPNDW